MTQLRRASGPKGHLLLGNLPEFRRDLLSLFTQARRDHGDLIRLRLAHTTAHVLCHPAMAEQALITNTQSIVKYSQIKPNWGLSLVLGKGLIMNSGDFWRTQRELINPMFRPKIIESFAQAMLLCASHLTVRLGEITDLHKHVDITKEMTRAAMEAALGTMFSGSIEENSEPLADATQVVLRHAFDSLKNPLMPPLSWPTARNRRFQGAITRIDDYINGLIEERIASGIKRDDLLGLFLEARYPETGKPMLRQQVRDEAVTMLGAGHETTATALTWALVQIARSPRIAWRMREELHEIVGSDALTFAHLRKLRYLQAVVQETLRLCPPVPVIPRAVLRETTIDGCHLPQGSMVFISVYNIQRHEDYWRNPEEFDPGRFLTERGVRQRHRCAYIPFGAGERFCIGSNFASVELQIFLARIVGTFHLHMVATEPIVNEVAVTMRPNKPVFMTFDRAVIGQAVHQSA